MRPGPQETAARTESGRGRIRSRADQEPGGAGLLLGTRL